MLCRDPSSVARSEAMARDDIVAYHSAHYRPSNVVFAAAGNLTHERVLELVELRLIEPD